MPKPNPMGSTFAERAAAARGDEDWTPPEGAPTHNSTFTERAGKKPKKSDDDGENSTFASRAKAVDGDDDGAENKAVAKKAAAKKS